MAWVFIACLIAWVACGIGAYGVVFAFFEYEYPSIALRERSGNRQFALLAAVFGPIALGVEWYDSRWRHGWRVRGLSVDEAAQRESDRIWGRAS